MVLHTRVRYGWVRLGTARPGTMLQASADTGLAVAAACGRSNEFIVKRATSLLASGDRRELPRYFGASPATPACALKSAALIRLCYPRGCSRWSSWCPRTTAAAAHSHRRPRAAPWTLSCWSTWWRSYLVNLLAQKYLNCQSCPATSPAAASCARTTSSSTRIGSTRPAPTTCRTAPLLYLKLSVHTFGSWLSCTRSSSPPAGPLVRQHAENSQTYRPPCNVVHDVHVVA
jgi:hypothetical protein